jgi:hypothetical protein
MKTEDEIRAQIKQVEKDNDHLICQKGALLQINAPVALMQISVKSGLDALYWALGEKRPKKPYDIISD